MENRIKKQQLMLFADRTSTQKILSNQSRLYFFSMAYVLVRALRRVDLAGTDMEKVQFDSIWLKLFKICAIIRIAVRISFAEGYPYKEMFDQIFDNMDKIPIKTWLSEKEVCRSMGEVRLVFGKTW